MTVDRRSGDRSPEVEARDIEVRGVVQGVGFRPFVWRLAARHGVAGRVRNASGVVEIHAEAPPEALDAFAGSLAGDAPPLARIDGVSWRPAPVRHDAGFDVDASVDGAGERLVSADAATCRACLHELFDPDDRRFRYPFINCTDCGPRFTIIDALPYDRERTSMRAFPMCADCRREYEDPADRRFHAEPVACPACGPRLSLAGGPDATDPVEAAAAALGEGAIVALKGLGGFHLVCDATDETAVARLRERKRRPDKPFAVMVADVPSAIRWFAPTAVELDVLSSWRAPVVLTAARLALAPSVAPGFRRHGVMLPSTPLHHLLLRAAGRPLVMTSGNASDEPICIGNDEAADRLGPIADLVLTHDRDIVARYDDSVVRVRAGEAAPSVLRRARSFAPSPIGLATDVRPVLGTGALLHGAFCLAAGRRAFLSQHVGDLETEEAMAAYEAALGRFRGVFRIEPEAVAHDLHPDLLSTRFAASLGLPTVAVQHHHAHVVATMAERGLEGEVLGLGFDGLGLGDDGTIWGGELLVCDAARYRRVGRLRRVVQPGGDAATRDPIRMALSHAHDAGLFDLAVDRLGVPRDRADLIARQIETGLASPRTSSAGRLFDAVAAIAGVCRSATFDGQPAMLLEEAAGPAAGSGPGAAPVVTREPDGVLELDTRPLVVDAFDGGDVAARFHAGLAALIAAGALLAAADAGLDRVVLGGGVFQNDRLTTALTRRLTAAGLRVFLPRDVPVGDGGIALGQVAVAGARMSASLGRGSG